MASQEKTTWLGRTGRYEYWFLPSLDPDRIKDEPGNYIFAKHLGNGLWWPIYIGITISDTLRGRLSNHNQWQPAKARGATVVWAHTNHDAKARKFEEQDLIAAWNPELNVHHRTAPALGARLPGLLGS